jgi:hypothetical protein
MTEHLTDDRAYQAGDTLVLRDRDAHYCASHTRHCLSEQGPEVRVRVTFVFSGDPSLRDCGGILPGYVVLALHAEDAPA